MERKFMKAEWRKKYLMQDMTVETFANWLKESDVVLLPIGSTEQHGPHLPLGVRGSLAKEGHSFGRGGAPLPGTL